MTFTRCRIDTINFPDDGHMDARNMYRIEINISEKELCVKLVIYKDLISHPTFIKRFQLIDKRLLHRPIVRFFL